MFDKFYTTKMSGNAKSLQKRFSKIRSKSGRFSRLMAMVITLAVLAATLGGDVVMAAVGGDGLEHWDKKEIYNLAGMKMTVSVDISAQPDWVKALSNDGKFDIYLNRVNIRLMGGLVEHIRIAYLQGNLGRKTLKQSGTSIYTAAANEKMYLTFDLNAENDIDTTQVYVRFAGMEQINYGGVDFKYLMEETDINTYARAENIEFIGNFNEIEKEYDYAIHLNYFTYFEKNFQNRNVDGVNIKVTGVSTDAVKILPQIRENIADELHIFICEEKDILKTGTVKTHALANVNGQEISKDNIYAYATDYKFESGKRYLVELVLLKNGDTVVCRQRDYVTIP